DVPDVLGQLAYREHAQPVLGRLDLDVGAVVLAHELGERLAGAGDLLAELLAVRVARILLEEPMQEGDVAGVDAALHALPPVALPQALEGERVRVGRGE